MLRIEQIEDKDALKQAALLLDRENQKLHKKIVELTEEIARLRGQDPTAAQLQLLYLKELLASRERALFGDKSERRKGEETTEKSPDAEVKATPRTGHGPRPQPKLPVIEREHPLDEADRACPKCGGVLTEIPGQTEDSESVTVIERGFVIVKDKRKKYRCACNGCIETAPGPPKLTTRKDARGRRYSIEFAVEVATAKYCDHLPLERQVKIMQREGLDIDSQTLWDQTEALARVLRPADDALERLVLSDPMVGADESWWRLMEKKKSTKWWAWAIAGRNAVHYKILDARSHDAARDVLGDYAGVVVADGYVAYETLTKPEGGGKFTLAHCWAHVRRKFVDAEANYPDPCREMLDLIRDLYRVERKANGDPGQLAVLRDAESRPIIEKIQARAIDYYAQTLPESGLGKAIKYMLRLWPGLKRFLNDPTIPLDNNATERALRGLVVGRKNHYGSRSKRGTEVAALFYG
ncbi:MAG: IS66 family transposase, partial [Solirubrobacterales bacterium]